MASSITQTDLNTWIQAQYDLPSSQNSWQIFLDKIRNSYGSWTKTELDAVSFYAIHLTSNTSGDRKENIGTLVNEVYKKTRSWDFIQDENWQWTKPDFGTFQAPPANEYMDHAELFLSGNTHTKNGYLILKGQGKAGEIKTLLARFIEKSLEKHLAQEEQPIDGSLREKLLQINQTAIDSIFSDIRNLVKDLGDISKINLITSFDKNFKPLDSDQLQTTYIQYRKKALILKSVEDKFNTLLSFANLPPDITKKYKVETSQLNNNKSFSISCENFLMAYSVFTFLVINNLKKK